MQEAKLIKVLNNQSKAIGELQKAIAKVALIQNSNAKVLVKVIEVLTQKGIINEEAPAGKPVQPEGPAVADGVGDGELRLLPAEGGGGNPASSSGQSPIARHESDHLVVDG